MKGLKKFDNFVNENYNNHDELYKSLIDACMTILDRWNDYVEWDVATGDSVQFHIRFDENDVLRGVEINRGRKPEVVDIDGISFVVPVYGEPSYVEMYDAEHHLPITFDQIVNKEGFVELLQFED